MADTNLNELVDTSSIVIKGTLESLGSSLTNEVPASEDLAVLRVDATLVAAPALGELTGTQIMILLSKSEKRAVGDQAIFFANPWIYASHLAVIEVGRVESQREAEVSAAIAKRPDRTLAAHLDTVELVIAGTVEKVEDADIVEPISEHAPEWKKATVHIDSVERGKHTGKRVELLFPSSDEPLFETAPKLQEGQEGVFLLHRGEGPFAPPDALTVIHPHDVQPRAALSLTRELLKSK
jgi:hypothetical protein